MSKNTITIISEGTTYYLSGAHGRYTGSGTPWDTESTSPYGLSLNDVTGNIWVAQPPAAQVIYRGGGQFGWGARPYSRSYGNVTETVGVHLWASTKDNAVFLLQQLRKALNTAFFSQPAQLGVQTGTNAHYAEIYHADIVEMPTYLGEARTNSLATLFRATITWTRSLFGVRNGAIENAIVSQSITNTGTGSPDNLVAYSASMSGELIYDGQPLNVALAVPSATAGGPYYLASVFNRTYTNTNQSVVTSSTTGATATAVATHDMTVYFRRAGITPRVIARITSPNALLEMQLTVTDFGNSTAVYTSPWIAFSTNTCLVDFGSFSPEPWRIMSSDSYSVAASFNFSYRSTSGGATTGTIDYVEVLDCYTFATITGPTVSTSGWLRSITFPDSRTDLVCLPLLSTFATSVTTYGDLGNLGVVRGELPKYFSGASLYAAWHDSTGVHTTTRTADVFAFHAPLWLSARGAD